MAMHLHRKETKMSRMAVPATILVLAGIAGTADAIGVNAGNGPFEVAESILYLSIPTMIYLVGACLAIFGGPTPVGPIPKSWRRGGDSPQQPFFLVYTKMMKTRCSTTFPLKTETPQR